MKEQKLVSYIASLLGVPASTLRYWDAEGLLRFERSGENRYRVPTVDTILDICDVMFYRSLSIPVKQIRSIPQMEPEALRSLLLHTREKLEAQKKALEESVKRIDRKQQALDRLEELERQGFRVIKAKLTEIRAFSAEDVETLRSYAQDFNCSAVLFDGVGNPLQYGMIGGAGGELIRRADGHPCRYLRGLLMIDGDCASENNADNFFQEAEKHGEQYGQLVGRYLLSACKDGRRYEYYEGMLSLK